MPATIRRYLSRSVKWAIAAQSAAIPHVGQLEPLPPPSTVLLPGKGQSTAETTSTTTNQRSRPVRHAHRRVAARHGCMRVNQHCVGEFWSDHVVSRPLTGLLMQLTPCNLQMMLGRCSTGGINRLSSWPAARKCRLRPTPSGDALLPVPVCRWMSMAVWPRT